MSLKGQIESQSEALSELTASERLSKTRCGDLEHQVQYLEMDKQYLTREVDKANARADRSEKLAEHCQDKLKDVERAREDLIAQLAAARQRGTSEYEQRLATELERQREQTTKESTWKRNIPVPQNKLTFDLQFKNMVSESPF